METADVFSLLRPLKLAAAVAFAVSATGMLPAQAAEHARPTKKTVKAAPPIEMKQPASSHPWKRYADWPQTRWSNYNTHATLVSPRVGTPPRLDGPINDAGSLAAQEIGARGAERGKTLAFDRSRGGGCVACHVMGSDTPAQPGNVGPDLSTIGAARPDDWLFNYIYEPRRFSAETVMPPWGTHKFYTIEEIRDIVAFLKTLKTPAELKDPLNDPERRPIPKEVRDNLDPTENPAMFALDKGQALFAKPGPGGKSCASCHAQPETAFKTWAATMPRYEPRMKKVLGVEEFITRHARATTGDNFLMETPDILALSVYLKNLANGTPINVDTKSPGAKQAAERGQKLMVRKIGQLNFACVDCHAKAANKWIRGQFLVEFKGQVMHFPTWRTSRNEIWDIRKRFQWCGVAIRADELPPDSPEYGDLELALTALSNGMKVNAPGVRH